MLLKLQLKGSKYVFWSETEMSPSIFLCFMLGFSLNNPLHQIIVARYSDANLSIDFDSFVCCLVRLESLFSKFLTVIHFLKSFKNVEIT